VSFFCKKVSISLHVGERNGSSFLKIVDCLSGLEIVRNNRRKQKYFLNRKCSSQDESILMILISVIFLRSFNHEFPRFEKKHYPWSDSTNKNTPTLQLYKDFGSRFPLNGALNIFNGSNDGSFAGFSNKLDGSFDFRPHGTRRKMPLG